MLYALYLLTINLLKPGGNHEVPSPALWRQAQTSQYFSEPWCLEDPLPSPLPRIFSRQCRRVRTDLLANSHIPVSVDVAWLLYLAYALTRFRWNVYRQINARTVISVLIRGIQSGVPYIRLSLISTCISELNIARTFSSMFKYLRSPSMYFYSKGGNTDGNMLWQTKKRLHLWAK